VCVSECVFVCVCVRARVRVLERVTEREGDRERESTSFLSLRSLASRLFSADAVLVKSSAPDLGLLCVYVCVCLCVYLCVCYVHTNSLSYRERHTHDTETDIHRHTSWHLRHGGAFEGVPPPPAQTTWILRFSRRVLCGL
jgi:hypothetical protein